MVLLMEWLHVIHPSAGNLASTPNALFFWSAEKADTHQRMLSRVRSCVESRRRSVIEGVLWCVDESKLCFFFQGTYSMHGIFAVAGCLLVTL